MKEHRTVIFRCFHCWKISSLCWKLAQAWHFYCEKVISSLKQIKTNSEDKSFKPCPFLFLFHCSERECSPCPAGWTPQGGKCFLFSQDRADWISSQYRCMTQGGAVATVRTEDEQVNTHSLIFPINLQFYIFIKHILHDFLYIFYPLGPWKCF